MTVHSFDQKDWKVFILLIIVFNLPPLLIFMPLNSVQTFAFLPYLFWVSIPGIPFGTAGLPFYEIEEFGAIPKGAIGWGLIVLFWIFVAYGLTMITKRLREKVIRKSKSI